MARVCTDPEAMSTATTSASGPAAIVQAYLPEPVQHPAKTVARASSPASSRAYAPSGRTAHSWAQLEPSGLTR